MPTSSLELSRQFTSFGGVDIRVVVGGEPVGTLQAISYAVQREKAPIYVMGRADPKSFSRGKRGIAGTLINLLFDQHLLFSKPFLDMKFVADNDELYPDQTQDLLNADTSDDLTNGLSGDFSGANLSDNYSIRSAWYVDQIPPFDAVIIAANEYGNAATMRIYGIEILNEGSGFSIDDMVLESQSTYTAISLLSWRKLGNWDFGSGAFRPSN